MVDENTNLLNNIRKNDNYRRNSSYSSLSINSSKGSENSEILCRICYEPMGTEPRICNCEGSNRVHHDCMIKWLNISNLESCEICHKEFIFIETIKNKCFNTYRTFCFIFLVYFFMFTFIYLGFVRYSKKLAHKEEKIFLNIHLVNIILGLVLLALYNFSKKECENFKRSIYIENTV